MSDQNVSTYLNDHLAGSVGALELLGHLEAAHADTALGGFFAGLRADIEADQRELEALMGRLEVSPSGPRQAAAWLAEKAARLKLRLDDPAGGARRRLEALEALAVGIEGKRALWRALAAAAVSAPGLRGPDYQGLERRADEQRRRVEDARLEAARSVLGGEGRVNVAPPGRILPRPEAGAPHLTEMFTRK